MSSPLAPLVLIDAVGLTTRVLEHSTVLNRLAHHGWQRRLREVLPAVTCPAQASMLTGRPPSEHGIVANGWLYRDTMEVRFWQQSNRLIQAEPLYTTARRLAAKRGQIFRCAKLFWWFNQGADVAISITPKPHYGAAGNKVFAISGTPPGFTEWLEDRLGPFPFQTFWGPLAGLPCTQWIANCAAQVVRFERPDLTLVYLPHLDYDPQRYGPSRCDLPRLARELDRALEPLLDAVSAAGARVWVVSEYGHRDVSGPVYANRLLRHAGLLAVRPGPFGETMDPFSSGAIAVCDHQVCHVYVSDREDSSRVRDVLEAESGIDRIFAGPERAEIGLDHARSGELVALARPDRWFAYPYWLDERQAPDFARTVDIHRKPGFDPCELFFDPKRVWPEGRAMLRLSQKKLGFRALMDVIPLDASLVGGSHGLPAVDPIDQPILIGDGQPPESGDDLPISEVKNLLLRALFG